MINSKQTFRIIIGELCQNYDDVSVVIDEPSRNAITDERIAYLNDRGGEEEDEEDHKTSDQSRPKVSILPTLTVIQGGFLVHFTPKQTGRYSIRVLLNSVNIDGSPFIVEVLPLPILLPEIDPKLLDSIDWEQFQANQVQAYGPGLESIGYVNRIGRFLIDLRVVERNSSIDINDTMNSNRLRVIIEGPSHASICYRDNGNLTCSISYLPTEIGNYWITVLYNLFHIHNSPFLVRIQNENSLKSKSMENIAKFIDNDDDDNDNYDNHRRKFRTKRKFSLPKNCCKTFDFFLRRHLF